MTTSKVYKVIFTALIAHSIILRPALVSLFQALRAHEGFPESQLVIARIEKAK